MSQFRLQSRAGSLFPGAVRGFLLLMAGLAALAAGNSPSAGAETAAPWETGAFAADPAVLLQAASQAEAGDGDRGVVVLYFEIRVRFEADGRETRVERMVYRIANTQAAED